MDFFCLPILCGCESKISGEGNGDVRVCPRCHNAAVQQVKKRDWFSLFCIPIIPYSTDHLWHCNICQWSCPQNGNFQPMPPGQMPQQHQQQFMQPGYQQPMGQPPANYGPPQGYPQQGYGPPQGYGHPK